MSVYSDWTLANAALRAYYRFGEPSGTVLDDVGPNNLDGTYAATGITLGTTGAILGDTNTAATFDGTSDPATVPDNNALDLADVFTIEFWVKRSATQSALQTLLNKSTGAYQVQFTAGNFLNLIKTGTAGSVVGTSAQITDELWHHIVITKNGTTRSCWVDGADRTNLGTNQTFADNTTLLRIAHFSAAVARFPGSLDELAFYSANLTGEEIQDHYELGKNFFLTTQTFTTDGTFIPPPGVERVHVECRGGGGAGGTATVNSGGGGGGGAIARTRSVVVVPGSSYAVVVGQGGTGAGGDSSFNSTTVVAKGGAVGVNGAVGGAGAGGAGGLDTASTGTVKRSGGIGGNGTGSTAGGGGGGGAGSGRNGGNASGATAGVAGTVGGGAGGAGGAVGAAGAGAVTGGAGGGASLTGARGNGARGSVAVSFVEAGISLSVVSPSQSEAIADTTTFTSIAAYSQLEALADGGGFTAVAVQDAAESLAEVQDLISLGSFAASEALAQLADLTSTAILAASEAIAEPPADVTTVALLTAAEALAQADTVTTTAFFAGLEALADVGATITVAVFTANWQRISPGLSGIVYDASGSTPIPGAQVLIFRDDTNVLIAELTSDAQGEWALDLDPAFEYWISGWKTGSPQVEDRTDRAIEPVETVVETGT